MMVNHLEQIVRLAIDLDLAEPARRRLLLRGLPTGFIAGLRVVDSPADQLRHDLMALFRGGAGLKGIEGPAVGYWLRNAAEMCETQGRGHAAQQFTAWALEAPMFDAPTAPAPTLAPSGPVIVLAMHPSVKDVWATACETPLAPI
ncbi:MAG: hypothetical protein KC620_24735, partial [Myxococcales bacterium]|nr:hypothetical protein [Myxococcales bacterium]